MNSGGTVSSASTEEPHRACGSTTFRSGDSETSLSLLKYTSVTDALQEQHHHHQRRDFQEQPYQPETSDWPPVVSQTHYPRYHHHLHHPHPRFRPSSPDPLRSSLNKELVVSQQHSYPSYHSTTAAAASVLSTSTATVALADSHSLSSSSSSSPVSAATAPSSLPSSRSSSSPAPPHHTIFSPNLGTTGTEIFSTLNLDTHSPSVIATEAFENPDHPTAVTVGLPSSPSPSPPSSPIQRAPRTSPSYSSHIAARQGSIAFDQSHSQIHSTSKQLYDTTETAGSNARLSIDLPDEDSVQFSSIYPTQTHFSSAIGSPTAADTHAAMDSLSWQESSFFFVQATHNYDAADDTFLPLTPLQIIKVTACEESGWWFGQCEGRQGWFPSNHVERVPDGFEAEYSSRPTSITSEEYAEISTGIDGVELQYFGGKLSDNNIISTGGNWTNSHLSQPSSPPARGGDHLAFPSRLSFIAHSSSHPSSPVEALSVHPLDQAPASSTATTTASASGETKPAVSSREQRMYTLDDFVTEIGFHLRNLEEAIEQKEAPRYLPLICNMMWCVRTLFMSADVYDRDSTTLASYPEIGKSRRTILLAFGKIYPQCWIANGDRAGYSAKDRQLAAEKMGQFGQQIARGIKNFTVRAKKCGLPVNMPGHEIGMSDLDFTAFDAKDAMAALGISAKEYSEAAEPASSGLSAATLNSGSTSGQGIAPSNSTGLASNVRNRRRVSRANSVKGFKSFNAIRQLRAEHASRYAAAKVSIEHLIADLMECLNDGERAWCLDNLIQHSIQASQMVTIFLASMDEMKAKITPNSSTEQSSGNGSGSNNRDVSKQRAELSRTLKDLATFIETLDSRLSDTLQDERLTTEDTLNRLMTLTSNILRCLLDMDIPHRSSSISQECGLSSDFYAGLSSSGSRGPSDNGRLSQLRLQQKNDSTSSVNSLKSASPSSRNNASAAPSNVRSSSTPGCNLMSLGGRKLSSLTSLQDQSRLQNLEGDPSFGPAVIGGGEKDSFMLDPRIAYGEAYGHEGLGTGSYRATHDSAVVMLSGESTPHQSLLTGPRKTIQTPIIERPVSPMEVEDVVEWTAEVPQPFTERRMDERKAPENSTKAATPIIQQPKASFDVERVRAERSPRQKSARVYGRSEASEEVAANADKIIPKAFSPSSQSSATFPSASPSEGVDVASPAMESIARSDVGEVLPPSMRNQRPRRSTPTTPASSDMPRTSPMIGPQNARRRTPRMPPAEPASSLTPNSPKGSIVSSSSPNENKANDTPRIPNSTVVTYTSIVPVKAETFTIVQEPELNQEYLSVAGLGIQMPPGSSTPSLGTRLPRRPASPAPERMSSRPPGITRARSPAPPLPNAGRDTVASRNRRADNASSSQAMATTPLTARLSGSGSMIKLFSSSGLQAPASSRKRNSLVSSRTSSDQQQNSGVALDDHPPPPPPKRGSRSTQSEVADRETSAPGSRSSAAKRATPSIRSPSPSSVVQFPAAVRDSHQSRQKQHGARRDSIQSIQSNLTTSSFELIGSRGDPALASQRAAAVKSSRASPGTTSSQYAPSIQSNRSHRLSSDSHHHQHMPQVSPSRTWRDPSHSQQQQPPQLAPGIMRRGMSSEDVHTSRPHGLPWFLTHDHSPEEVLFNEENALQAATLEAMIEILTSHRASPDPSYVTTFFATFRLFTTPLELTTMLVSRFQKNPPVGLTEGELLMWKKQKLEIIQRRVQIAFKTWLDGYWFSPKDREAFKPIMDFVTKDMMIALPVQAGRMQEMLTLWSTKRQSLNTGAQRPASLTKARSYDRVHQLTSDSSSISSGGATTSTVSSASSSISGTSSVRDNSFDQRSLKGTRKSLRRGIGLGGRDSIYTKSPPAPLMTKTLMNLLMKEDTMRLVPVTDIKPVELARQLTLYVNKLFLSIPYLELLDDERPNCPKMIQTANKITAWVTDTIVDEQDVKKRINVLKYWIEVCEECVKLNNFDSLTAIVCAIESTPVKRLDITWEGVNKGYRERLVNLRTMISNESNYKVYRAKLKEVQAPCIPFLGLYLTTVMMIKDGNSMYKDPSVKSILPGSRQSHASSRISTSSAVSMASHCTAAAAGATAMSASPAPSPSMSAVKTSSSTPKPKLLRYIRFSRLATSVLEFRNFQGQYEYLEVQPLRNYIEHKLNSTDPQDSERNYRKSYAIEPRYHPPAPPGTALPPPGHYRPMPTSYLPQSAIGGGAQSSQTQQQQQHHTTSSSSSSSHRAQHQSMPSQPSSSVQHSRTSSQSSTYLSGGGMATAVFNPHHSHPVPPPPPPKVPTSTKANKFSRLWRSGRTYSKQP